jgi:hypothetical protein
VQDDVLADLHRRRYDLDAGPCAQQSLDAAFHPTPAARADISVEAPKLRLIVLREEVREQLADDVPFSLRLEQLKARRIRFQQSAGQIQHHDRIGRGIDQGLQALLAFLMIMPFSPSCRAQVTLRT